MANKKYELGWVFEGNAYPERLENIYNALKKEILINEPILKAPSYFRVSDSRDAGMASGPKYFWNLHKVKKDSSSLVLIESYWDWGKLGNRDITIYNSNCVLENEIEKIINEQNKLTREIINSRE